jgi:hypothetical protein
VPDLMQGKANRADSRHACRYRHARLPESTAIIQQLNRFYAE